MPAASRVRASILEFIQATHMAPGDRLPSEEQLSLRVRASRPTVREALRQLEYEQVVYCTHGLGRFVAGDPKAYLDSISTLRSVTELAATLGFKLSTRVLGLRKRPPTPTEMGELRLRNDEMVIELERMRAAEEQPIIYSVDIFPERMVVGVPDAAAWEGSLLELMDSWNVHVTHADTVVHAVLLPARTARLLRTKRGLPWIMLRQINYDARQRPVLYSMDYHRADKFSFRLLRRRIDPHGGRAHESSTADPQR